jgi:hypothetical protein
MVAGPDVDGAEVRRGGGGDEPFGQRLVLRVERERFGFEDLGDVGDVLDAEDAAGGSVDEASDAGGAGLGEEHADGVEVGLAGEHFVDFAGGIVGNGGEVDDGVDAG